MGTMLSSYFVAAGAAIIFVLGSLHLFYTFVGNKLHPRDAALKQRMQEVSPVITRETTMWRTWIGFNASHSLCAILFGLLYTYLPLAHAGLFFGSAFLVGVGLAVLAALVVLGRMYWFSIPFRGIVAATVLYSLGLVVRYA
jgi:sterol desaturase/sphingolipid hydroxylase (fatty acid hydroxylase superfamily)